MFYAVLSVSLLIMTDRTSWPVSWCRMVTSLIFSVLLTWQMTAALSLVEMQQDASNAEDEISNIALIPLIKTLTFPQASIANTPYPFSNIPEGDLSNFLNHINPDREQKDVRLTSENINNIKTPSLLNQKEKAQQDLKSTCSKYIPLEDTSTTDSGVIEVIKYLCEYLSSGPNSSEIDVKDETYFASSENGVKVTRSNCNKNSKCKIVHWSKNDLRSLLTPASLRPVRTGRGGPGSARMLAVPMPYIPINGRREWMVLNEEYPGMMKHYMNHFK